MLNIVDSAASGNFFFVERECFDFMKKAID